MVSIPRLGRRGPVSFLIDSGADGSVLMPDDAKRLGLDHGTLEHATTSTGIGGLAHGFEEVGVFSFSDGEFVYSWLLQELEISRPTYENLRFPSLLGRDVLGQWRLVLDRPRDKVRGTPHTWDRKQKI